MCAATAKHTLCRFPFGPLRSFPCCVWQAFGNFSPHNAMFSGHDNSIENNIFVDGKWDEVDKKALPFVTIQDNLLDLVAGTS